MKKDVLIKILALGVVVLFICVGFQPAIANESIVNENSNETVDVEEAKELLFDTIIDIGNNPEVKSYLNEHKHDLITNNNINYDCKNAVQKILSEKPKLLKTIFSTKTTTEYLETIYNMGLEIEEILGEEESSKLLKSVKNSNSKSFIELKNIILSDKKLSNEISNLEEINKGSTIICLALHYLTLPIVLVLQAYWDAFGISLITIAIKILYGGDITNTEWLLFLLTLLFYPIFAVITNLVEIPLTILYNIFDCWDIVPDYPWE